MCIAHSHSFSLQVIICHPLTLSSLKGQGMTLKDAEGRNLEKEQRTLLQARSASSALGQLNIWRQSNI